MRDSRNLAAGNSNFGFGRDFTHANPLASDAVSGNGFASFLLGYTDSGSIAQSPKYSWNNGYYALFAQDNWRISDRLTVTPGLRWDTETPIVEAHGDQNSSFDPNAAYFLPDKACMAKCFSARTADAVRPTTRISITLVPVSVLLTLPPGSPR
jgi:outer membrane receptor protein involved in Fe transport